MECPDVIGSRKLVQEVRAAAELAHEVADRWLEGIHAYEIEAIYLIGSYAEGKSGPGSDIDLLFVGEDYDAVEQERINQAEMEMFTGSFAVLDTSVRTEDRPGHPDVIFSSDGPRKDQAAVKLYDRKDGWCCC